MTEGDEHASRRRPRFVLLAVYGGVSPRDGDAVFVRRSSERVPFLSRFHGEAIFVRLLVVILGVFLRRNIEFEAEHS